MSFDYQVMTPEQANEARYGLLKDGEYQANITSCVGRYSGANNFMFDMNLRIISNGVPYDVREFLSFTPKMMWKVLNCMSATNLMKEYNDKNLHDIMLVDKDVCVLISREEGQLIPDDKLNGKPKGSKYPDKNRVVDYLVSMEPSKVQTPISNKSKVDPEFDDDIPFWMI